MLNTNKSLSTCRRAARLICIKFNRSLNDIHELEPSNYMEMLWHGLSRKESRKWDEFGWLDWRLVSLSVLCLTSTVCSTLISQRRMECWCWLFKHRLYCKFIQIELLLLFFFLSSLWLFLIILTRISGTCRSFPMFLVICINWSENQQSANSERFFIGDNEIVTMSSIAECLLTSVILWWCLLCCHIKMPKLLRSSCQVDMEQRKKLWFWICDRLSWYEYSMCVFNSK